MFSLSRHAPSLAAVTLGKEAACPSQPRAPRTMCVFRIPVSVPGLARHAVLPPPPPVSDLLKLLFYKIDYQLNYLESTLLQVFILENLKSFAINTYEKQGEGCQLWLTKYYKKVSFSTKRLTARQASLSAVFPHFPLFPSALCLRTSARKPIFHLPYTLPSSVSPKSFICHSYENCRGVHQQFPFWNSSPTILSLAGACELEDPDLVGAARMSLFRFSHSTFNCRSKIPTLSGLSTSSPPLFHGSRNTGHESRLSLPYIITSLFRYLSARFARLLLHCSTHGTPTPRPTLSLRSPLARRDRARHSRLAALHRSALKRRPTLLDRNWSRPW
jgi:hypothetical protein